MTNNIYSPENIARSRSRAAAIQARVDAGELPAAEYAPIIAEMLAYADEREQAARETEKTATPEQVKYFTDPYDGQIRVDRSGEDEAKAQRLERIEREAWFKALGYAYNATAIADGEHGADHDWREQLRKIARYVRLAELAKECRQ